MNDRPIILIQNTAYHFETMMSIYRILLDLGYAPHVYRCAKNIFGQEEFLKKNNIKQIRLEDCRRDFCGIVVSAYPSAITSDRIPNAQDPVFSLIKKLIYISHRFMRTEDYEEEINRSNVLCLSPLAQKIGMDFIHLTDNVLKPKLLQLQNKIHITIQGHFELHSRDPKFLGDLLEMRHQRLSLKILGTQAGFIISPRNLVLRHLYNILGKLRIDVNKFNTMRPQALEVYQKLDEEDFYQILNNETHFLLAGIDPFTKNSTYVRDRYSSNFNQSLALEKPIICHEAFGDIYQVPGVYYKNSPKEAIDRILGMNNQDYSLLVEQFKPIKKRLQDHNRKVIAEKIRNVLSSSAT